MKQLMKVFVALGLALGACGGGGQAATPVTPAPSEDGFRIAYKGPAVGLVETQDATSSMKLVFAVQGQEIDMTIDGVERRQTETLEVAGDLVTRAKVRYEAHTKTQTMMGQSQTEQEPTHGATYLLQDDGGKLAATREDGAAVSADELDTLIDDYGDEIGRIPGEARIITGRSWKAGERHDLTADDLALLAEGKSSSVKPLGGAITFVKAEGGFAWFEVELKAATNDGEKNLALDVEIDVKLDVANARPVETRSSGTVAGTVITPQGPLPVKGTMEEVEVHTYR